MISASIVFLIDCDTGVHLGSPNQPRQMRRHIPRVSDIRRRVTLTHSDTDCGRRHVNVGHCRRRHSIHDVDGQKSIVSGLSRIPLDIGHIGRGDEAIDGESVHPNTRYACVGGGIKTKVDN